MNKIIRIALVMQGGSNWMGGVEYIKSIIFALMSLPLEDREKFQLYLICSKSLDSSLYEQIRPFLKEILYMEDIFDPFNILRGLGWQIFREVFFLAKQIDFVYPSLNKHIPFFPCTNSASWIPDFQHKYLPSFFQEKVILNRDRHFKKISRTEKLIVLSSKSAQADFQNFFPHSRAKTKVLSFKTSPRAEWFLNDPKEIQEYYCLPDKFFIICNQFWQHKNHLLVFDALKILQDKGIFPTIVCTGSIHDDRNPNYTSTVLQRICKLNLNNQVHLLGLVPRLHQMQLIRRSIAVLQPSLFEGWSSIVEDARCLGKPLIISDILVHIEQNPPESWFFNPNSPSSLADILVTQWENLTPGPDLEREEHVQVTNQVGMIDFAYQFLEIANDSIKR